MANPWHVSGWLRDKILKLDLTINLNLFLWEVETGYLRYVANRQLSPSAALAALYTTSHRRQPHPTSSNGKACRRWTISHWQSRCQIRTEMALMKCW